MFSRQAALPSNAETALKNAYIAEGLRIALKSIEIAELKAMNHLSKQPDNGH